MKTILLVLVGVMAGCVEKEAPMHFRERSDAKGSAVPSISAPPLWGGWECAEFDYSTLRDGQPIVCRMLQCRVDRGGSVAPLWCAPVDGGVK